MTSMADDTKAAGRKKASAGAKKQQPAAAAAADASATAAGAGGGAGAVGKPKKPRALLTADTSGTTSAESAAAAKAKRKDQRKAARQKKRARGAGGKDNDERELESLVFGAAAAAKSKLGKELDDADADADADAAAAVGGAAGAQPPAKKQKTGKRSGAAEAVAAQSEADGLLFQIDTRGALADGAADAKAAAKQQKGGAAAAAAWVDEDDAAERVDISAHTRLRKLRQTKEDAGVTGDEYQERLRAKFTELNSTAAGGAEWAKLPARRRKAADADGDDSDSGAGNGEDDDGDDDGDATEVSASSASMLLGAAGSGAGAKLPASKLSMTRLRDVAESSKSEEPKGVISAIEFHPNGQLLLTGCMDKKLRLFNVDTVRNTKVQTVSFPDLQIYTARFLGRGSGSGSGAASNPTEVVVSGRRKYFYTFDLNAGAVQKVAGIRGRAEKSLESFVVSPDGRFLCFLGNDGYVLLLDGTSKQLVATLKMNGSVRGASFSGDSRTLWTIGGDAEVYAWDVASRRCIARHVDDGSVSATTFACSADGQYYATGNNSGVVNLYQGDALTAAAATSSSSGAGVGTRKATKSLMNLTTSIHAMAFNYDSQLLAIASNRKKDALRMVHLPTATTFADWPTAQTPLRSVSSLAFSPNSGLFAIGNDHGRVLLYRVNHYTTA